MPASFYPVNLSLNLQYSIFQKGHFTNIQRICWFLGTNSTNCSTIVLMVGVGCSDRKTNIYLSVTKYITEDAPCSVTRYNRQLFQWKSGNVGRRMAAAGKTRTMEIEHFFGSLRFDGLLKYCVCTWRIFRGLVGWLSWERSCCFWMNNYFMAWSWLYEWIYLLITTVWVEYNYLRSITLSCSDAF